METIPFRRRLQPPRHRPSGGPPPPCAPTPANPPTPPPPARRSASAARGREIEGLSMTTRANPQPRATTCSLQRTLLALLAQTRRRARLGLRDRFRPQQMAGQGGIAQQRPSVAQDRRPNSWEAHQDGPAGPAACSSRGSKAGRARRQSAKLSRPFQPPAGRESQKWPLCRRSATALKRCGPDHPGRAQGGSSRRQVP